MQAYVACRSAWSQRLCPCRAQMRSQVRDAVPGMPRSSIAHPTHELDHPIVLGSSSRAAAGTARRPQRFPCCCCPARSVSSASWVGCATPPQGMPGVNAKRACWRVYQGWAAMPEALTPDRVHARMYMHVCKHTGRPSGCWRGRQARSMLGPMRTSPSVSTLSTTARSRGTRLTALPRLPVGLWPTLRSCTHTCWQGCWQHCWRM